MKMKLMGIGNFVVGGLQLWWALMMPSVLGRMDTLYLELGVEGSGDSLMRLGMVMTLMLAVANVYLGYKLLVKKEERYVLWGVVAALLGMVVGGMAARFIVAEMLGPVYSLGGGL